MIQIDETVAPVISLARLRQNKAASGRAKDPSSRLYFRFNWTTRHAG
jgi:hypothetical protein